MSFSDDLARWTQKVEVRNQRIFAGVVAAVHESITVGSPLTGAPGQPVDTGNLRSSWQQTFESPTVAAITTNVEYAPIIEDNVRGVTFKNHGPHSVKLTRAGFPRLVDQVTREQGGT